MEQEKTELAGKGSCGEDSLQRFVIQLYDKLEEIAEKVHNAWWDTKKRQGFHAPLNCDSLKPSTIPDKFERYCERCHTDMYPYKELSEDIKDYDRVTVKAVLDAVLQVV